MYIGLHVQYRYCCPSLMKLKIFNSLSKNTQILNYMKIRPAGAELFNADRRTDRHD